MLRSSGTRGFFVTGTDTGVGKTLVACAILHLYVRRGLSAVGMKPVAAGAYLHGDKLVNDDVVRLGAAGNVAAPADLVNPYCFAPAIAPHLAASHAGVTIELERIVNAYHALAAMSERVVVEGAGGYRVPLDRDLDTAGLAVELGLPVIMVVGMRLGCLNHALLTADAVRSSGLVIAGWVANHIDPAMACPGENVAALEERLGVPLLARICHSDMIDSPGVASRFRTDILH